MENKINDQVLSAFWLLKDNLIHIDIFNSIIDKLKSSTNNPTSITEGQYNYIKRLMNEGKIPINQSLEITKNEAQVVIHNALNNKMMNRTEFEPVKPEGEQMEVIEVIRPSLSLKESDLYKDKNKDY